MTLDQLSAIDDIRQLLGLTDLKAGQWVWGALQVMQIAGMLSGQQDNATLETTVITDTTGVDITTAILMEKYRK